MAAARVTECKGAVRRIGDTRANSPGVSVAGAASVALMSRKPIPEARRGRRHAARAVAEAVERGEVAVSDGAAIATQTVAVQEKAHGSCARRRGGGLPYAGR